MFEPQRRKLRVRVYLGRVPVLEFREDPNGRCYIKSIVEELQFNIGLLIITFLVFNSPLAILHVLQLSFVEQRRVYSIYYKVL